MLQMLLRVFTMCNVIRRLYLCVNTFVFFRKVQFYSLYTFCASILLLVYGLPACQKASCDRPSSDGEATHENGHSDCKDQGESTAALTKQAVTFSWKTASVANRCESFTSTSLKYFTFCCKHKMSGRTFLGKPLSGE